MNDAILPRLPRIDALGVIRHGMRELGLSLIGLARMLSMTPAGVAYAARRGERIAGEKGLLIGSLI